MRRGEVWRYRPVLAREGRSLLRLILSADDVLSDERTASVYAAQILAPDPGGLLAVRIGDHGWASVLRVDRLPRGILVERVGEATAVEMEQVGTALRAVFDL